MCLIGDLKFESSDLIEDKAYVEIEKLNLKNTEMVLFASMLAAKDSLQLASVKAVDQNYPLVGGVELQSNSIKQYVKKPPDKGQVWLDSRLLDILDLKIGEIVSIGDSDFLVSHSIISEPDRASNSFAFAPKAIINMEDLEALSLLKKKMFKYARDLQFEKAAMVRDKLTEIEDRLESQIN